jgi:hypothetical protein
MSSLHSPVTLFWIEWFAYIMFCTLQRKVYISITLSLIYTTFLPSIDPPKCDSLSPLKHNVRYFLYMFGSYLNVEMGSIWSFTTTCGHIATTEL